MIESAGASAAAMTAERQLPVDAMAMVMVGGLVGVVWVVGSNYTHH